MPPVMDDQGSAAANTAWLHARLQASGTAWIPPGTMYVAGTATTANKVGCGRIKAWGGGGYPIEPHPTQGKVGTRIVQTTSGPIVRIAGAGFVVDGPIEFVGDSASSAIQLEGRQIPACGFNVFNNMIFKSWDACFEAIAGYYVGDTFTPNENHADNSIVNGLIAQNCIRMFKSTNQQAVIWTFNKVNWGWDSIGGTVPVQWSYLFDCVRGGKWYINGLEVLTTPMTFVRVEDYSPNNCQFGIRDVSVDRMTYSTDSVSITRSSNTATVTHTAHGLFTGMRVIIAGCTQTDYNGSYIITKTGANTYTYTVSGSPATPATGSPTSTPQCMVRLFDYNGDPGDANFSKWKFKIDNMFSSVFIDSDDFYNVPVDLPQTYWDIDYTSIYTS